MSCKVIDYVLLIFPQEPPNTSKLSHNESCCVTAVDNLILNS
jgi:hypothetical protein